MFFYEGHSCPYCQKPFTEEDDIVSCPECGAPHHRHCWKNHGVCAHAADHNTENQWTRDKAACVDSDKDVPLRHACPNCGADNSPYAEICGHCGRPLAAEDWSSAAHFNTRTDYTPPPYGGFNEYAPFRTQTNFYANMSPKDTMEGETVEDIATVVRTNTPYYLPKFQKTATQKTRLSWNWAAFFIPSYWLLYRKQYLIGCLMLLLEIVSSVSMMLIITAHVGPAIVDPATGALSISKLIEAFSASAYLYWAVLSLNIFSMLLRVVTAMFGNYWYYCHVRKTIRRTREMYPEGYSAQLAAVGGTSIVPALVGYMCMNVIPQMVILFTMGA